MKIRTPLTLGILASLLIGVLAGTYTSIFNQQQAQRELQQLTQQAVNELNKQIIQVDLRLQGLQGLVVGAGHNFDHALLRSYLTRHSPLQDFPTLRGFCLIQPVAPEDTAAFEANAQRDDPNFKFRQYAPYEGTRYLLTFLEPAERLGNVNGLDMASEPMRRRTLERAQRLGIAQLTPPLHRAGTNLPASPDYLLVLPVLLPPNDELFGWVAAPVFINDLWAQLPGTDLVNFYLQDGDTYFSSASAHTHASGQPIAPEASSSQAKSLWQSAPLKARHNVAILGRAWQLQAAPKPAFFSQLNQRSSLYAGLMSALLGASLTVLLASLYARRRERTERIQNQQELLAKLIDAAPCGMMFIDQDYRFVALNHQLCLLTGFTREALEGQSFNVIMGKDDSGQNLLDHSRPNPSLAAKGVNFEMMAKRADGSQFPAAVGFSTLALADQRYIVATLDDISHRKAIEEKILASEAMFRSLANAMPQHVWIADQKHGLTFVSSRMARYFGRELELLQMEHWPDIVHPEDLPSVQIAWLESIKNGTHFEAECRLRRADGQYFWHITRASSIADPKGNGMIWYGTNTDISDHKQVQLESQANAHNTQAIIDSVVDALITIDGRGTITSVNASAKALFGYSESEMLGQNVNILMPEPHRSEHDNYLARYQETGKKNVIGTARQLEGRHKDGSLFKIELRVAENIHAGKRYFLGMIRDITERFHNEKLLESQDHILRLIARNTEMPITLEALAKDIEALAPDIRASILVADKAGTRLLHGAAPSLPVEYNAAINGIEIGPKVGSCGTAAFFRKQIIVEDIANDPLWKDYRDLALAHNLRACWSTPIFAKNELLGTFAMYFDTVRRPTRLHQRIINMATHVASLVFSHDRRETQIRQLAFFDSLTSLPNRALGLDRLSRAIADAHRRSERLAVIFIDLDGFKNINDSLGHHVGDKLLQQAGLRLNDCVRENDTVARLGGDEFFVIINGTSEKIAEVVTDKVLQAMSDQFQIDNQTLHLSCSMGVALFPADGQDASTLLRNADAAMYKAKEAGRNTVKYYTEDMNRSAVERITLEQEIRLGIDNNEFELYYQPRINNATNTLIGLEALVRWQHPSRGFLPPNVFIPVAEQSGLIVALGDWVLQQACRQLSEWLAQGCNPISVSVNLSPRQFHDAELIGKVKHALSAANLPPSHLELEITESMVMDEGPNIIAILHELKSVGVNLAIDDFGTGYSNLSRLKHLPVDVLKIDKSFVDGIPDDVDDVAIATTIIAMAHHLRLKIVAEGVETFEQRRFLSDKYCDEMQGYLFGKPESVAKTAELLKLPKTATGSPSKINTR
ncbi:EAL domain-containing protein [Simiduia aestuariiviva]|uniref:Sensor protein FixL n=1 Tax=Simiduia aestuariiviva TaxID=1510459 RepID=A0A839UPN7_9GAMM|nr:EAL domain-containing protein [Simiduia aestuariiviva]MBB3167345.1 diguanylate cyclase (GGDEF)-like protein/PAS domain S-box-containing protein [Simiduia aestuariiviva]